MGERVYVHVCKTITTTDNIFLSCSSTKPHKHTHTNKNSLFGLTLHLSLNIIASCETTVLYSLILGPGLEWP